MKILYKNFLKDRRVYRPNIAYWHRQIKQALDDAGVVYEGEKYLADRFSNGELFYDGNPIYNAFFTRAGKALRVVQEDSEEFEEYYTSFKSEVVVNGRAYEELVIVLTLSEERKDKALLEIQQWVND